MVKFTHLCYVLQISHHSLANKQQLTDAAITSLLQQLRQDRQERQDHQDRQERQERQAQQSLPQQPAKPADTKRPWYKQRKAVAAVVWGATNMLQHNNVLLRSVKVASLVLLVHDR